MHLNLECLSNEILDRIFYYVDGTHKPTLKALSLVNHHVHATVCSFLFTPLRLHIRHQDEVSGIVESLPARVIQHVRHLTKHFAKDRLPLLEVSPEQFSLYGQIIADFSSHVEQVFFIL